MKIDDARRAASIHQECGGSADQCASQETTRPSCNTRVNQMSPAVCSFCSHANPHGSAFCNGCGAALKLTLCEACEAINDRTAANCHKCGAALSAASPPVPAPGFMPPVEASDPLSDSAALSATPRAMNNLEPSERSARSSWPQRRVRPAFVVLPLCVLGAVTIYAYQRREPHSPPPATPVAHEIPAESSTRAGMPEAPLDMPEQRPNTDSSVVAHTPASAHDLARLAEEEPAPATTDAGSNDGMQDVPSQPARKDDPPPQAAASAPSAVRAEGNQRQNERNVKRESSLASSKPSSSVIGTPRPARSSSGREEVDLRPPAACTDALAALALCNRSNPDRGP